MLQRYRTQIAGDLRATDQLQVIKNPFNGEVVAEVGLACESELELALARAHEFFERGARPATHERPDLLRGRAQKLREHAKDLAELIARESGKPIRYARGEVARAVLTFTLG